MVKSRGHLGVPTRTGLLVAMATGLVGLGVGPASASTDNFGQAVYDCAGVMLPYSIGPQGRIVMTMPDGSVMAWRTFGEMVNDMRTREMC